MNILILTANYIPPDISGLSLDNHVVHDLVKPIARKHDVRVLYYYQHPFHDIRNPKVLKRLIDPHGASINYKIDGVNVHFTEVLKLPRQTSLTLTSKQQIALERQFGLCTDNGLWKPLCVVAHMPLLFGSLINKLSPDIAKMGIIHSADKLFVTSYGGNAQLLNRYDSLFARSASLRDYFRDETNHSVNDRIVFSGINEAIMSMPKTKPDRDEPLSLLYVGKLIKRKNVDLIIDAFHMACSTDKDHLTIVGTGPEEAALKQYAYSLLPSSSVSFTGNLSHNEVIRHMKGSHIFLMPSIMETFGMVYLEAMSQGCITIGTKNEGIDGIIHDGSNGFLTEPTSSDLANVLKSIVEMPPLHFSQVSCNAIETADSLTTEKASGNYLEAIQDTVKTHSKTWRAKA